MQCDSILFVGANPSPDGLVGCLAASSWQVSRADDIEDAIGLLRLRRHDVVVIDAESAGAPPWPALDALNGAIDSAVLVVPPGTSMEVFDGRPFRPHSFLTKPVDRSALVMAVESALAYRRLLEENRALRRQLGSALDLADFVGCTPESQEVRDSVATAALATGPVLLLGESGSGRRLAAELIHRKGRNPGARFLPVEVPSLPEGQLARLLQELTSSGEPGGLAPYTYGGLAPGTLFLSEVNGLSALDQKSLAELLSEALPFRLMASAHPSLREAVRQGRFSRRLFDRLSALTIHVPPLRDRRADVPVLIDHFLRRACERLRLQPLGIPPKAIERYITYDWPGNVAELMMVIDRAASLASAAKFDATTLPEHFCAPRSLTAPEPSKLRSISLRELIADIEKRMIIQTLEEVDGSQKKAAERLRLNPTTLHEKMKRYRLLRQKCRQPAVALQ